MKPIDSTLPTSLHEPLPTKRTSLPAAEAVNNNAKFALSVTGKVIELRFVAQAGMLSPETALEAVPGVGCAGAHHSGDGLRWRNRFPHACHRCHGGTAAGLGGCHEGAPCAGSHRFPRHLPLRGHAAYGHRNAEDGAGHDDGGACGRLSGRSPITARFAQCTVRDIRGSLAVHVQYGHDSPVGPYRRCDLGGIGRWPQCGIDGDLHRRLLRLCNAAG